MGGGRETGSDGRVPSGMGSDTGGGLGRMGECGSWNLH